MTQELQKFRNPIFGELEILTVDGKEYFPATKVAAMLGYKRPEDAVSRHCILENNGSVFHGVIDPLGRVQNTKFITHKTNKKQ